MLSIYSCVAWPSVCLLWRNVCLDLPPIFLIRWFALFYTEQHVLSVYFGGQSLVGFFISKYFLPSCVLSFHFVSGFLCCAKASKFNQFPFAYFCFYFHYPKRRIRKDFAAFHARKCSAYVFLFTFRSLIHFEFVFVYGVREHSNFILLHTAVQFSQDHSLKETVFSQIVYSYLVYSLSQIR